MQMLLPQMGPKKKHRLTSDERKRVEKMLDAGWTPYKIAKALGRPPKTIMREITSRAIKSLKGSVGRINNRCVHRFDCQKRNDACRACLHANRSMLCRFCRQCNSRCQDYIEQKCEKLEFSPFVCNGCGEKLKCPLAKKLYVADDAHANYTTILSKSREGANITEDEPVAMDNLIYKLTGNGQSVHAAVANNPDVIPVSEKTVYRYVDGGLLKTKNGDLPRKGKGYLLPTSLGDAPMDADQVWAFTLSINLGPWVAAAATETSMCQFT